MLRKKILEPLPEVFYQNYLKLIGGIYFTQREIDVIACILGGRTSKTIAALLNISSRTVETHVRNVTQKLGRSSRNSIVAFIEQSSQHAHFQTYYRCLIHQKTFEKNLLQIAKEVESSTQQVHFFHGAMDCETKSWFSKLCVHLKIAGVKIGSIRQMDESSPTYPNDIPEGDLLFHLSCETPPPLQKIIHPSRNSHFCIVWNQKIEQSPVCSQTIYLSQDASYYRGILQILQKIYPPLIIETFLPPPLSKEDQAHLKSSGEISQQSLQPKPHHKECSLLTKRLRSSKGLPEMVFLAGFLICVFFLQWGIEKLILLKIAIPQKRGGFQSCSSSKNFLPRSEIIKLMANKLKMGKEPIQTFALIGPKGSGKTTLARLYSLQYPGKITWEFKADSPLSLQKSLQQLAKTLCKTSTDQERLDLIQHLKNQKDKETQLIMFVSARLKAQYHPWLLIYDHLKNIVEIQKYIPCDPHVWGSGHVLLTTRDDHLQNNIQVTHALHIREIKPQEEKTFFTSVTKTQNPRSYYVKKAQSQQKTSPKNSPPS